MITVCVLGNQVVKTLKIVITMLIQDAQTHPCVVYALQPQQLLQAHHQHQHQLQLVLLFVTQLGLTERVRLHKLLIYVRRQVVELFQYVNILTRVEIVREKILLLVLGEGSQWTVKIALRVPIHVMTITTSHVQLAQEQTVIVGVEHNGWQFLL
jgi:hypothetical protein